MSVMKTQNIVSRALIGNMQKLVAEGRSLQLIFPREDIGYTYNIYNSTRGSIDSMESINFSNPDNGEVRLTVGAMIPHCWMRISDHSTENSIPVEMFDQKQQSFKDIVSTLQLPAITEVLLQNAEFACTPKFLLVVLDSSISQWSSVIQQSIHCNILRDCLQLVSVRSQAVITHDVLQKALQTPNYQHPSEAFDRKLLKLKKPQKNSLEYLVVEDCTGRWLEKCEQFNISRSACRKQVSSCSVSVLVRPDGHVSEVHVEDREKSVDITREERIDFLLKFIEQTLYALE